MQNSQGALKWKSVWAKRDEYKRVYRGLQLSKVAAMSDAEVEAVLADTDSKVRRIRIH